MTIANSGFAPRVSIRRAPKALESRDEVEGRCIDVGSTTGGGRIFTDTALDVPVARAQVGRVAVSRSTVRPSQIVLELVTTSCLSRRPPACTALEHRHWCSLHRCSIECPGCLGKDWLDHCIPVIRQQQTFHLLTEETNLVPLAPLQAPVGMH